MTNKKRIQVDISKEAGREIEELRCSLNLNSIADVIRSSLKLTKYIELEKKAGNEIIIRNKSTHREREIVFLR